jgi:EAL domain-containing protein (putative c-di-GMP-specific phosphodiesterase class I)
MPLVDMATEVITSCTIGIAVYPKDGEVFDTLLSHADMAMYAAKEMGRNTFLFYDESLNIRFQENLKLISGLRNALIQNEFVLHYQPVFDMADGKIIGAEALVRWLHPEMGLLYPTEFIPAAEKSGLILGIGEWVIAQTCKQMKEWQSDGIAPAVMAVNLSPVQFKRGNIADVIGKALIRTGLQPNCLEFELTESTVIEDPEDFMVKLQELKRLGVKIAIDDFGTGYSNLAYLQRFSVDKLKIDQSFVKQLQNGPQDRAIVTAIIQLAKSLNLKVVAEGIEDHTTYQLLADLQCHYGQGYWLCRPQAAQEFIALVKSQAALS